MSDHCENCKRPWDDVIRIADMADSGRCVICEQLCHFDREVVADAFRAQRIIDAMKRKCLKAGRIELNPYYREKVALALTACDDPAGLAPLLEGALGIDVK